MKNKRSQFILYLFIYFNFLLLCDIVSGKTFRGSSRSHGKHLDGYNYTLHSHSHLRLRRNEEEETVCDTCHVSLYDTPFYCPIKPDLPQCIFPICPKICDDVGGDPTVKQIPLPPSPPKRPPFPHPVYLPRIPEDQIQDFSPPAPPSQSGRRMKGMGRTFGEPETDGEDTTATVELPPETFVPYNPDTCEFPSASLRRLRPGSKYIEYRPNNHSYQVSDIYKIAADYGLVLAEFRHPMEWYSVEKSSILESVSSYKMTKEQPRRFYAVGLSDHQKQGNDTDAAGTFVYRSDNTNPTFAVFDPRIYGRTDEKCGVLSHVMGTEKRQYLTTRFWNCDKYMGDGKRVAHGLFMFPPGSACYHRSEEECAKLQQEQAGGDAVYHNVIQIGQTLKRFIYLYTDQRSWQDAFELCKAKGLHMLDFDIKWGDALRTGDVIEHFLRETRLNPVTSFWTSGRFEKDFSDGQFIWGTTNTIYQIKYKSEPPPFAFSWWDDQKVTPEETLLSRRGKMIQPCVSVALNPEIGGERPKINFKAWYCDFPMYVICYKELNATDIISNPVPTPITATRTPPLPESCEKPPDATNKVPTKPGGGGKEEEIDPFTEETCTSKSLTVKRLTPTSKYVDYQPKDFSYSVEQIKEQCVKYDLLPAEIRTIEDWESIEKSGIGGVVAGEEGTNVDYFYVIGMDDSKEPESMRYGTGDPLTFSLFSAEGPSESAYQCAILESVPVSGEGTRGLMMLHANCKEGHMSEQKVAYGLCMFPPTWKCFKDSTEEISAAADTKKFTTIIPLGATDNRSIFFNPVQRTREDALKFSQAANLSLLDFDSKWEDTVQVIKIFREKLVKDGGFFQLTPFWTSGKLQGTYLQKKGKWETTGEPLIFPQGPHFQWIRLKHPHLARLREGIIRNACIETVFDSVKSQAKFHPDYCDVPKYFLMYRVHKRRGDPLGINQLGITVIETGPRHADTSIIRPHQRRTHIMTPPPVVVKATTVKDYETLDEESESTTSVPQKREIGSFDISSETTTHESQNVQNKSDTIPEDGGSSSSSSGSSSSEEESSTSNDKPVNILQTVLDAPSMAEIDKNAYDTEKSEYLLTTQVPAVTTSDDSTTNKILDNFEYSSSGSSESVSKEGTSRYNRVGLKGKTNRWSVLH